MYRFRVNLSVIVDAKSPAEAARMVEPVLASLPAADQFTLSVKGDNYFGPPSNGRMRSKSRAVKVSNDY